MSKPASYPMFVAIYCDVNVVRMLWGHFDIAAVSLIDRKSIWGEGREHRGNTVLLLLCEVFRECHQ
jgi:hypothetical protein